MFITGDGKKIVLPQTFPPKCCNCYGLNEPPLRSLEVYKLSEFLCRSQPAAMEQLLEDLLRAPASSSASGSQTNEAAESSSPSLEELPAAERVLRHLQESGAFDRLVLTLEEQLKSSVNRERCSSWDREFLISLRSGQA